MARFTRSAGSVCLALLLAACGEDVSNESVRAPIPEGQGSPVIEAFIAGPGTIVAGSSTRLSWRVADAASIAIEDDGGNALVLPDPTAAIGSVEVTPGRDTRYTLTASALPGDLGPVWRSVSVTVTPAPDLPPEILSFTATPQAALDDADVVLRWETRNAVALGLKDDVGRTVDLTALPVAAGEVTVRPDARVATTTWELTAAGPGGHRVSAEVTVTRLLAPRITVFTVLPLSNLEVGSEATITWETSRAERVVITDSSSQVLVDTTESLSGSQTVALDRSTGYTLSATGPGGEATAALQVPVGPRIAAFSSSLRVVRAGDPVQFDWQTSGADGLHLTGPGGLAVAIPAGEVESGTATVDVHESGDFTLTALRDGVARTWSIFIEVTDAPRVRSFTATPAEVTASPDQPAQVTLSWVQDGGGTCTLYGNNRVVQSGPCGAREGGATVTITESTVFRFLAVNEAGEHGLTASVEAVPPARILVLAKAPTRRLTPGDPVTLSWEVVDATSLRLERDGTTVVNSAPLVGTHTEAVLIESTYLLVASNRLGDTATATLTVEAGAPELLGFEADPPKVAVGAAFTLSWTVDGGESLTVTDAADTVLCTTTVLAEIDAGTCPTVAPAAPGTYDYTLAVTNGAGTTSTLVLPVVVTDGPQIDSLTASRAAITAGESVTLSWLVGDDAYAVDPTLALVDDQGNTYDVAAKNPNADSITVTLSAEGIYVFTLTASTAGTISDSRSVQVEVGVPPVIDSLTADPATIDTQGGQVFPPVTLSWTSQNGRSASLWALDAGGQPIPPALLRLDDTQLAQIAAGSLVVNPQQTTTYLLRVTNRIGSKVERTVKVVVDPVQIVSFTANPLEIVAGEHATLDWVTKNATEVKLDPREPTTYDRSNSFLDVSVGGTQVQFSATYNSYTTINFPAGFTFPYDGVDRTGVRMSTSGFLSFDLAGTGNTTSNYAFPYPTYGYVHLAPYWEYLNAYSTGTAWYHHATDPVSSKQYMVFMWKNWSYYTSSAPFDMNFEVILWEDGVFEFRYGTMWGGNTSSGTSYQYYADGRYATIGFQNLSATWGWTVLDKTDYPGGLSNRGWAFDLRTGLNFSKPVNPPSSRIYTLTAKNADGQTTATAEVTVHPKVNLQVVQLVPSGPQAGDPFEIRWKANPASKIVVTDGNGTVICTVTDPALVAEGACTHTEANGGYVTYTVEATNVLAHNVTTRTINAYVFPRLSIDASNVSAEFVTSGTAVTFTWQSTGALDAYLDLCVPGTNHASCTPVDISSQTPAAGSYTTTLTESKEFWFRVFDGIGRSREVSHNVWVDAPELTSFTASSTQITAGSSVTLTWTSTGATKTTLKNGPPVIDASATKPYIDVSAAGQGGTEIPMTSGSMDSGRYDITFPPGFTFPWYGNTYGQARATTDGLLTFDMGYTTTAHYTNYAFPTTSYPSLHMSPFWDDLGPSSCATCEIWTALKSDAEGPFFVIQWKGWASYYDSTGNLNFEIILRPSGDFEYRYQTMYSGTASYADGSSATIGYQAPGGTTGVTLSHNTVFPGGIANKSFPLPPNFPGNSSITLNPTETTTYELCVTNASLYKDCESITIVVVQPGDILISELMIAPGADDAEWFEIRNVSPVALELGGWTLSSGSETYTIPTSPGLLVPAGAFAVLARSGDPAVNGGVSPALVYGSALQLGDTADDVAILLGGVLIDRVTWTSSWTIAAGKSLALEPSVMARSETVNNTAGNWCAPTTIYGGGFTGSPGGIGTGCLTSGGYQYYLLDPASTMPFIDISGTGTSVSSILGSSYYTSTPIGLPFVFPYFGDTATSFTIGQHGYLALAPVTTYYSSNSSIPNASTQPNGLVAPFWDYMYYSSGTTGIYWDSRTVDGQKVMIVQWDKISSGSTSYGTQTYQAQLWENGDIVFSYPLVTNSSSYTYWSGGSATVGLENLAGNQAIQIYYGTSSSAVGPIYQGRTFHFRRK